MATTLRSRVITAADVEADPNKTESSYLGKVVRYIPGEIVAAYLAAYNGLRAASGIPFEQLLWGVAAVLLAATPFWILYATKDPDLPPTTFQAGASTLAFAVWVFAIPEGPFAGFDWYNTVYGSLALIAYTLLVPLAERAIVKPRSSKLNSA